MTGSSSIKTSWFGAIIQKASNRFQDRSKEKPTDDKDNNDTVDLDHTGASDTNKTLIIDSSLDAMTKAIAAPVSVDVPSLLRHSAVKVKQSFSSCLAPATDLWDFIPSDHTCSGPIIGGQKFEFSVRRTAVDSKPMDYFQMNRIAVTDDKDVYGIEDVFDDPPEETTERKLDENAQPRALSFFEQTLRNLSEAPKAVTSVDQTPALTDKTQSTVTFTSAYHQKQAESLRLSKPEGDCAPIEDSNASTSRSNSMRTPPHAQISKSRAGVPSIVCGVPSKTPTTINTEIEGGSKVIKGANHLCDGISSHNPPRERISNTRTHIEIPAVKVTKNDTDSELEPLSSKEEGQSVSLTEDISDLEEISDCNALYNSRHRYEDSMTQKLSQDILAHEIRTLLDLVMIVRQTECESGVKLSPRSSLSLHGGKEIRSSCYHLAGDILGVYEGNVAFVLPGDTQSVNSQAATIIAGHVNGSKSRSNSISVADVTKKMIMAQCRFWDLVCAKDYGHSWLSTDQMARSCLYTPEDIKRTTGPRLAFGYWENAELITSHLLPPPSSTKGKLKVNCGLTFINKCMIIFAVETVKTNDPIVICDPKDNDNYLRTYIAGTKGKFSINLNNDNNSRQNIFSSPMRSSTHRAPNCFDKPRNPTAMRTPVTTQSKRKEGPPQSNNVKPDRSHKTKIFEQSIVKDIARQPEKVETTASGGDGDSGFEKACDKDKSEQIPVDKDGHLFTLSIDAFNRELLECSTTARSISVNYDKIIKGLESPSCTQKMQMGRVLYGFNQIYKVLKEPKLDERLLMDAKRAMFDMSIALLRCEKQMKVWQTKSPADLGLKNLYLDNLQTIHKYSALKVE